MNKDLRQHYDQFLALLNEEFLPVLNRKIDRQITFLHEIKGLQVRLSENLAKQSDQAKQVNFVGGYKEKLKASIQKRFNIGPPASFAEEFKNYDREVERYLSTLPDVVKCEQKPERFRVLSEDPFQIKILKVFKRLFYGLSQIPFHLTNVFRSEKKKRTWWSHKIFFRNLTEFYLKDELCYDLLGLKDIVYQKISQTARIAWENDEYIDEKMSDLLEGEESLKLDSSRFNNLDEAVKEMDLLREDIASRAVKILDEVYKDYEDDFVRVGTIELSNRTFDQSHLDKAEEGTNLHYMNHHEEWQNTFLLLSDDWGMDIDLYLIMFGTMLEYWLSVRRFDNRIDQKILEMIEPWSKELEKGLESIRNSSEEELKGTLEQQIKKTSHMLSDEKLLELNDLVLGQDLPSLVNNIDAQVDKLISSIDSKRAIAKNVDFSTPVKTGSFNLISPYELISFESYPHLLRATKKVRVQITEHLNKCQTNVLYLGQIVGFNLQSAVSLYEEEEPETNPKQIAVEGMERTIRQLQDLEKSFIRLKNLVDEDLLKVVRSFFAQIGAFTDNENILELRMRIAKGKALVKSQRVNERVQEAFQDLMPKFVARSKRNYHALRTWVDQQFTRYGIKDSTVPITAEVSDFLAETKQAIQRLPFVYQRLFSSESLKDENFFVGRGSELQAIHRAYNNWTKGRFAATAVIGEKGSGVTTLLHFFIKELTSGATIYRMTINGTVKSREDLLEFLNEEFNAQFENLNEVLLFLQDEKEKKVIVLEGLHNAYMKRIGGFEAIRAITELIAHTSRQVFWLVGCTAYAWSYLEKTNQLNDHFGYVIHLKEFDDLTINSIIRKRHKVSGYNLVFEPSVNERTRKKFQKMTPEEQQVYLERSYFNELNKIAKSNVSLALNYWLRSTKEVKEDAIVIGSLKDRDTSFMNSIIGDKLYGLSALIMHEGLSEENFASAMSISASRARAILHPLYEDGIIILDEDQYVVNPLLYRQTINLLKARNIIH
jgi:hypothetical protein